MCKGLTAKVKAWIAITMLGSALAVPVSAGVACCVVGPIARSSRPEWLAVTTLETLPADGMPRKFPIVVTRFDAWCHLPDQVIGYVYLRRTETHAQVLALRTANHAGCAVEFNADKRIFEEACWGGHWDIDGHCLPSAPKSGSLYPVGAVVRGDAVYVSLPDLKL
jgi:menaquinol-cytochrome c reductase iron-sulfur subunit